MINDTIKIKGFYRVQIVNQDGSLHGDSGEQHNQIVNLGFLDYLCKLIAAEAGSKQISHLALGSGAAPGAADTSLAGEVVKRQAITAATSSNSKYIQFTGTFSSGNSFVTNTQNLSNIALANTSSGGTIFSGAAYVSSSCATNQDVNVTYTIQFG